MKGARQRRCGREGKNLDGGEVGEKRRGLDRDVGRKERGGREGKRERGRKGNRWQGGREGNDGTEKGKKTKRGKSYIDTQTTRGVARDLEARGLDG